MLESNLYYIYIDTKIKGTIDQLLDYFRAGVFNTDACICVYFKYYKDIEKYIQSSFIDTSIQFKFIRKNSDLNFISNKVVFYLFNAQSNCKIVARRDLVHIFVTHGESHKLASIKPIIRIYDCVITSGQVGIDRYLKAGIFTEYDIQVLNKVIPMGNTFIGQHSYVYNSNAEAYLYAPTWEGGIPSENYCSLNANIQTALFDCLSRNTIKKVYIQPHPNLGHRDQAYLKRLITLADFLRKSNIKVCIVKSNFKFKDRWYFKGCEQVSKFENTIDISGAIVDISAMEMQLVHSHVPTTVLINSEVMDTLIIPKRVQKLYAEAWYEKLNSQVQLDVHQRYADIEKNFDYLISYFDQTLQSMTFQQRIAWLCHFSLKQKLKYCLDVRERY